jgi:hypothetical protein
MFNVQGSMFKVQCSRFKVQGSTKKPRVLWRVQSLQSLILTESTTLLTLFLEFHCSAERGHSASRYDSTITQRHENAGADESGQGINVANVGVVPHLERVEGLGIVVN